MNIQFHLNDTTVELSNFSPDLTLLDYLRLERGMTGSKEGCAEGDCGACTVLVGRLNSCGELTYESVNGCIRFMGSLNACHIVTIEHLRGKDGELHPVQQAMVDCHGSQCGFCTPGFIMSLYGLWLSNPTPSREEVEQALQGNLCRCTGYAPILRAMDVISKNADAKSDPLYQERERIKAALSHMEQQDDITIHHAKGDTLIPKDSQSLAKMLDANPNATIIAGSTDVGLWVSKHMKDIAPIIFINHLKDLQTIEDTDSHLKLGAGVTYSDAQTAILDNFPQLQDLFFRIGGQQVRNMGTIGGNIANGSPIGDTPPPLITLGASVELESVAGTRSLPLEEFFIEYGKQDRARNEFVKSITIPKLAENEILTCYKISKRKDEDISALCWAIWVRLDGELIADIRIAMGGMAGTPKRATAVETALKANPFTLDTCEAAMDAFEQDYAPLSDWRASSDYRMLVSKNLLKRFYLEQSGGSLVQLGDCK